MSDPAEHRLNAMSLDELFELAADRVYGSTLKRCGDPSLAEEITAAVFEAASRQFAAGRGHEVTVSWLVVVAQRRLIDHWRYKERHVRRIDRLRTEMLVRSGDERQDASNVLATLDSLSTKQRAVLVLRYLDDLSVSEIADQLGTTYKATESLLSRARKAFSTSYWEHQ